MSQKEAFQNGRKRPNTNPISLYFKKIERISEDLPNNVDNIENEENETTSRQEDEDCESNHLGENFSNDIGLYLNKKIDDFTKCQLLENIWKPPKSYKLPFSIHKKCGKEVKRYLGHQHLEQRNWLAFSDKTQGLFCKFCVLFPEEKCGHNKGITPQNLVTQPLTSFAKLLGKDGHLQSHEETNYHKRCVQASLDFLKTYHNPEESIDNRLDSQRLQQVKENRERLRPILETIIFLGRQNIPLRGHRDDGRLEEEATTKNEGNFRELLRFKVASGDETLKQHLSTSSSRATYISSTTQNQLISCCGEEITDIILKQVREAKFYSVIFDETTDISHVEQLSFNLRYIHNHKIREDFIKFIDAYENIPTDSEQDHEAERCLNGKSLGKIVLEILKNLSLDPKHCIGIGTDSCSVMSSEAIGAVAEIQKSAKNAYWCPCLNHALNNSLSKSVNVVCIRNTVGVMKSVISFFNSSAKRNLVLKSTLGHQLSSLCETRWIERHVGIIQFGSSFHQITEALESISMWKEAKTSSAATTLINSICTAEFLISMMSLIDILKVTLPLSRLLQTPSLDLNQASKALQITLTTLNDRRANSTDYFNKIYMETKVIAEKGDVEMKLPRLSLKQTKRENHPGNVEEYFRRSLYIPLLDNICIDLKTRISSSSLECFGLRGVIPSILTKSNKENEVTEHLKTAFKKFSSIIENGDETLNMVLFEGELDLWKNHWNSEKEKGTALPGDVLEVLGKCNESLFPTISVLLKILATLPVSVSTAERTFSTLRRVKTWLRARMGETRLTGLCLLHVHRDIELSIEKIIERFSKTGLRRLEFVL